MSPGDIVPRREQDKVFKELRDTRIATLLAENAALRARLAQAEAESTRMQHERDNERTKASEYRANAQVLRDKLNGDFWVWQHDGEDYPESLTCPILIHADHVREILGARAQAQARVVEMEGALRIIENHPRAKMACGYDIRADYDNGLIQGHRECAQIARRALSSSGLEVAEAVREAIVVLETNEILEIDETGRVTAVGSRKDAAKVAAKLRALGLGEGVGMSLWWLQPGWTQTSCASCGAKIWPEGDPGWGYCYSCFTEQMDQQHSPQQQNPPCDICGNHGAVAGVNGYGVCSQECADEAERKEPRP